MIWSNEFKTIENLSKLFYLNCFKFFNFDSNSILLLKLLSETKLAIAIYNAFIIAQDHIAWA